MKDADPILALIGDLYSQIVALQQQNAELAEQLQQSRTTHLEDTAHPEAS